VNIVQFEITDMDADRMLIEKFLVTNLKINEFGTDLKILSSNVKIYGKV